ncbi:ATP-grasp domain-containing protein [Acanthopleuribacter pedis]|uniref:ATP-grasp domain-containing protein n=1 Tax=Acanthopleuribacter pedis TaxID=442870 RepID=A0A8J7QDS9_9BACT|nr:ATP-grasp domain-containing protein [Acanthopleuribacter pedis]MBO1322707.1 ATP-grasp domain-containing protein [Acanthopleuribacter pedis]
MTPIPFPIERIYLQEQGNGKLRREEQLLADYLRPFDVPIETFTEKRMRRRTLKITANTPVVGDVAMVLAALKCLDKQPPSPLGYPEVLMPYLHRNLWRAKLQDVIRQWMNQSCEPVFIKPADDEKKFTGKRITGLDDLQPLTRHSGQTTLWCSSRVTWLSEYRAYVVRGCIKSVAFYAGDADQAIDLAVVAQAVAALGTAAPAGYSLDFGLLDTGQTGLVEANDGYSLGAYDGIDAATYGELILARWFELTTG